MTILGWDIGGVNTKAARVERGAVRAVRGRPYELQRAPGQLGAVLRAIAGDVGADLSFDAKGRGFRCAVTLTAELSQMFRTKRDGVSFVLDAVESTFPESTVHVFAADGRFLSPEAARQAPLAVAAANWAATAGVVAEHHRDAVLIDIGTTSTDVIPIVAGHVAAEGLTDPDRLASGELVYTGALRTPAEAIVSEVPFGRRMAGVSAEGFALAGDVHLWRGDLAPEDYTVPAPDGRPAMRAFAGERLARVVCADREMVDEAGISAIADALADAQVRHITAALSRVLARHPSIRTAIVTGLGAFLGVRAARAAGLAIVPLAAELGEAAARCAPAACVALLLDRELNGPRRSAGVQRPRDPVVEDREGSTSPARSGDAVDLVVKLGGGVLAHPDDLDAVLTAIASAARERRLLVVPGGGPFADAVRDVDRRLHLPDDAAHWMAVLAMDQYAHLIASRLDRSVVVESHAEAVEALRVGRVPVLAPSRWLRAADPLPHSWDVTSDSIAAWVAGEVGARALVLIKPPHAAGGSLLDAHFGRVASPHVAVQTISADRIEELRSLLAHSV